MKAIIKGNNRKEIRYTIDFLLDYGIDSFIVFAKLDNRERYILENELLVWDIRAVVLEDNDTTYEKLQLIKGSFTDTFLIAYSSEISNFDLIKAYKYHKTSTKICTLLSTTQKTVGIFLEIEIFDYMDKRKHFEKEIIRRAFQDDEANIYNLTE